MKSLALPTSFSTNWVLSKQYDFSTSSTEQADVNRVYAEKQGLNIIKTYEYKDCNYSYIAIGY